MKNLKQILFALFLLLSGTLLPANAETLLETESDSVWKKDIALLTNGSQITSNNSQSGFPPSNLLRPESEGFGTNQIIWHTSWGNPAIPPANTDTYLQVHFNNPEKNIIFSMIGSNWQATYDTPTEVIIKATNEPGGEWKQVAHLKDMQYDFTSFSPDRYTSPCIEFGEAYSYVRFIVKNTVTAASGRRDANGNPFVSLGRFQVYRAVKGVVEPIDKKQNINLLFIGNSITYGAGLSNPATQAPPVVCSSLIEKATDITVNLYNGGHSGITTLGFMPGRNDFTRVVSAAKALRKSNGGLIYFSIMLGTNDSACSGPEGAPVNTNTYKANIKAIIDKLIEEVPDCKILLNYPIWYSPNTHNGATYLQEGLDRLYSYYPIIDSVVEEYEQVFAGDREVWNYFEDNKVLFQAENGYSGTFYLHPNVDGAKRLAEVWARSLIDIIATDSVEIKKPIAEWNLFKPSNDKKYIISTSRGDYGVKNGFVTNKVKTNIGATTGEFAFITYEGKQYIYSVEGKSFISRDRKTDSNGQGNILLSDSIIEPFKVQYTGGSANYPYCLTSLGYIANVSSSTQKGVVLNTYNKSDKGNQTKIVESGDFDPTEALKTLKDYFDRWVTVTYRIEDVDGNLLEEFTSLEQTDIVISKIPETYKTRAYTTYTVNEPITIVKGEENIVRVVATWELPFEVSPNLNDAHWYNLALNSGADYVTVDNGYRCNPFPTKEDVLKDSYQWAFKGNPYTGIIVYNRTDTTKTLAKVNDRAILDDEVYSWKLTENEKGFLLVNNENGLHINEYGGAGGYLGFFGNADGGSIFSVSEVGRLTVTNVKFSSGAAINIFKSSPDKANGRAILIIPGGGYSFVAGSSEGADWVPFFNDLGYTAAVLTYTVPPKSPDAPLGQAKEAMKYLRDNAEEYNVTTGMIGVMGFSAGGHLASTVATHTSGIESPAFQILIYPVITMDANYTHAGSRTSLLGASPTASLVNLYSNEKQVTENTPMAYINWANDDGTVPPRNSTEYANALKEKGVPVRTKSFPTGGHGYGFNTSYKYHDELIEDLTDWMKSVDNVLTSIEAPIYAPEQSNIYYDISGKLVDNPVNGIYINAGRKILIK